MIKRILILEILVVAFGLNIIGFYLQGVTLSSAINYYYALYNNGDHALWIWLAPAFHFLWAFCVFVLSGTLILSQIFYRYDSLRLARGNNV